MLSVLATVLNRDELLGMVLGMALHQEVLVLVLVEMLVLVFLLGMVLVLV